MIMTTLPTPTEQLAEIEDTTTSLSPISPCPTLVTPAAVGEVLSSEEQLERDEIADIIAEFRLALRDTRDHWLRLGQLCHDFILRRLKRGCTVHSSRCVLSDRMSHIADQVQRIEPGRYIGLWAVVELLGKGEPGGMTLSLIREFRKLVVCNRKSEKWYIMTGCEKEAVTLFKDARRLHWGREQIRNGVKESFPNSLMKGKRAAPAIVIGPGPGPHNPINAAITADPRDTAELLSDIIRKHERHDRLVEELRRLLPDLFGPASATR